MTSTHVFYGRVCISPLKELKDKFSNYFSPWMIDLHERSKVGIAGENVERLDLRDSMSIRDSFRPLYGIDEQLEQLFEEYKIGVGSAHMYKSGGFMKPHRDARREDFEGLPHIMNVVVLENAPDPNDGGALLVDGVDVVQEYFAKNPLATQTKGYDDNLIIIFPINSIHEVTPVKRTRISYVFPIYGIYDPYRQMVAYGRREFSDIYEGVLQIIDSAINNHDKSCISSRGILQGAVDSLHDSHLSSQIGMYRMVHGDYIDIQYSNGVYLRIDEQDVEYYRDGENGIKLLKSVRNQVADLSEKRKLAIEKQYMSEKAKLSVDESQSNLLDNANSDYISATLRTQEALGMPDSTQEELTAKIAAIDKAFTEVAAVGSRLRFIHEVRLESMKMQPVATIELPQGLFLYAARDLYYNDTICENLVGIDRLVYMTAIDQKRKVTMIKSELSADYDPEDYCRETKLIYPVYKAKTDSLVLVDGVKEHMPNSKMVNGIYPEHDDEGHYPARFKRMRFMFVIE